MGRGPYNAERDSAAQHWGALQKKHTGRAGTCGGSNTLSFSHSALIESFIGRGRAQSLFFKLLGLKSDFKWMFGFTRCLSRLPVSAIAGRLSQRSSSLGTDHQMDLLIVNIFVLALLFRYVWPLWLFIFHLTCFFYTKSKKKFWQAAGWHLLFLPCKKFLDLSITGLITWPPALLGLDCPVEEHCISRWPAKGNIGDIQYSAKGYMFEPQIEAFGKHNQKKNTFLSDLLVYF